MDKLEDMIWNSLFSFLGKVVNTTTCLIENFIGLEMIINTAKVMHMNLICVVNKKNRYTI